MKVQIQTIFNKLTLSAILFLFYLANDTHSPKVGLIIKKTL